MWLGVSWRSFCWNVLDLCYIRETHCTLCFFWNEFQFLFSSSGEPEKYSVFDSRCCSDLAFLSELEGGSDSSFLVSLDFRSLDLEPGMVVLCFRGFFGWNLVVSVSWVLEMWLDVSLRELLLKCVGFCVDFFGIWSCVSRYCSFAIVSKGFSDLLSLDFLRWPVNLEMESSLLWFRGSSYFEFLKGCFFQHFLTGEFLCWLVNWF